MAGNDKLSEAAVAERWEKLKAGLYDAIYGRGLDQPYLDATARLLDELRADDGTLREKLAEARERYATAEEWRRKHMDDLREARDEIAATSVALVEAREKIATLELYHADWREAREKLVRAEGWIARQGYVRCDIPACNCPFWHGGDASNRLMEISDELGDETQGVTILDAVRARGEKLAALEADRDLREADQGRLAAAAAKASVLISRHEYNEAITELNGALLTDYTIDAARRGEGEG